ncbi:MAG TPA: Hsp20/alpha crystallin family protein [Solirubrobacterales bacterium]|nr:Hsp20/alpha crystallin family protein [Solirubrobacterales bacterium]
MALVRWEPMRELNALQGEMNRLFNSFFDEGGNGAQRRWAPAVDLVEREDSLLLRADLPGLSEDDVQIEVRDNILTISGERKAEHEDKQNGYYRVERSFGRFSRSLQLPSGVEASAIQASFDRGVLEVTIPKPEERKPRRIEINGSQPAIEGSASEQ